MSSLYIHIPFCRKKCLYCDFYSSAYDESLANAYIDTLCGQIKRLEQQFFTIYIGGGTPTVLGEDALAQLFKSLKRLIRADTEFTVEANPESLNANTLDILLGSGVNRLSVGAQSFNDDKLRKIGRIHNAKEAYDAVYLANQKGIHNISIDLMFGIWGEEVNAWQKDLEKALRLPVTHISAYALTYEENTPLFALKEKKSIILLENELVAKMFEYTIDYLEAAGFSHYEISNFAKEGFSCRHNLNYWENNFYIGLGPSAVSYSDGVRKENISDIREYIARVKEGKDIGASQEKLSDIEKARETAAVKIRTKAGINFEWFKEKTGFDFLELEAKALATLTEAGFIGYNAETRGISLTRRGVLFSDTVSSEFL